MKLQCLLLTISAPGRGMLVWLFEGLEGLEAAVGEEHGADDSDGERYGRR